MQRAVHGQRNLVRAWLTGQGGNVQFAILFFWDVFMNLDNMGGILDTDNIHMV